MPVLKCPKMKSRDEKVYMLICNKLNMQRVWLLALNTKSNRNTMVEIYLYLLRVFS